MNKYQVAICTSSCIDDYGNSEERPVAGCIYLIEKEDSGYYDVYTLNKHYLGAYLTFRFYIPPQSELFNIFTIE